MNETWQLHRAYFHKSEKKRAPKRRWGGYVDDDEGEDLIRGFKRVHDGYFHLDRSGHQFKLKSWSLGTGDPVSEDGGALLEEVTEVPQQKEKEKGQRDVVLQLLHVCSLCGDSVASLESHLWKKHDLTIDLYD